MHTFADKLWRNFEFNLLVLVKVIELMQVTVSCVRSKPVGIFLADLWILLCVKFTLECLKCNIKTLNRINCTNYIISRNSITTSSTSLAFSEIIPSTLINNINESNQILVCYFSISQLSLLLHEQTDSSIRRLTGANIPITKFLLIITWIPSRTFTLTQSDVTIIVMRLSTRF